jgi:hypothetical protein
VWEGGPQQLRVTASVGISMKGHERDLLEGIISRLGTVGESGQAVRPTLQDAIDPHCMQLLYAQHGLSLSSMVDFYAEENSAMADFQYHHSRWFGNGQQGSYGQGGLPVFSSTEAERLVLHPQALGDPHGRPLHKRIVREPFAWRPEAAGAARGAGGVRSMGSMGSMNRLGTTGGMGNSNGVGTRAGQGADPGRGFPSNE